MTSQLNKLLAESSQDEMSALVQALALSVVQHRARCAFVSLDESINQLEQDSSAEDETGLFLQGGEVIEETLELLRIQAAEKALLETDPEEANKDPAERRWQLRISVRAPIKVRWPGGDDDVRAVLENISWGGVAFHTDEVPIEIGENFDVILPSPKGGAITIQAKVLRSWKLEGEEGHGVAARFTSISTKDEPELENILELLSQSADDNGVRRHARLAQRLDIQFDGEQELHATMNDISAGGMGITVPDPLQIGQSIQAVISSLDGKYSLKLRARVVRQEPVHMGRIELFHIGLKFEHPSEELAERTEEFVHQMASLRRMAAG